MTLVHGAPNRSTLDHRPSVEKDFVLRVLKNSSGYSEIYFGKAIHLYFLGFFYCLTPSQGPHVDNHCSTFPVISCSRHVMP